MFIPEYSITSKTLKNIATLEYAKAVVETTPVLTNFQLRLKKESETLFIADALASIGISYNETDSFSRKPKEFLLLENALTEINSMAIVNEIDEETIREIRKLIEQGTRYRQNKISEKTPPEEILAEIAELFDWYNSLDAKETHPIIVSGIINAGMELIYPYSDANLVTTLLCTTLVLRANGYAFNEYLLPSRYFSFSKKDYLNALSSIIENDYDFTSWLEFFTENIAAEASNIEQKVRLLARDTKLAKSTGRTDLSPRQERIIEYLQDYGMLQNKQFAVVFSDVSEDSILRDLKKLMDMEIVVKRGSTKSSRYELK